MSQNIKKMSEEAELSNRSMLKKNEISLVFLGAGILTVILFFLFFRTSGDKEGISAENSALKESFLAMEQRLTRVEEALQTFDAAKATLGDGTQITPENIEQYTARVERVETALSVKFDIMTARVDKMEDKLSAMSKAISKNSALAAKAGKGGVAKTASSNTGLNSGASLKSVTSSPTPMVKKAAKTTKSAKQTTASKKVTSTSSAKATTPSSKSTGTKKTVTGNQPVKKSPAVYHTIAKGDTLYNISKKYNTTVPHLRNINGMSSKDAIIIGQKLKIKE